MSEPTEYEKAQWSWGNDLILEDGYCPCDSEMYVTGNCPIHDTKSIKTIEENQNG